jgi:DNA replication protein DnaC
MTFNPKFAQWLNFNTFQDPQLILMVTACHEWVNAVKNGKPPRWLTILGNSGTGKTHCAYKLWNYAHDKFDWTKTSYHEHVVYWPDFVQKLRMGESFAKREEMKRWPVLCLDDVGAERDPSGFAAEELNSLLGCRVGKWTLLTSNATIKRLSEIDERISSRLIRPPNICVAVQTKDFGTR